MRNFGKAVKMMAMALVMSAFFCSCNVSGGSSYDASSEASKTNISKVENGTQGTVAPAGSGISIKFKQFGITVETAGDRSEVARGESLEITCSEKEGSEEIGLCDWYIGTSKVASGKSFTFSQTKPGVYSVSCIAADSATNPLYADSVQLSITVR